MFEIIGRNNLAGPLLLLLSFASAHSEPLYLVQDNDAQTVSVFREGDRTAYIVQNAKQDFRPYIHPIVAPDGKGVLTQFSPGHHKHQTGLYWGHAGVNGRRYFHNPGGAYWKKIASRILTEKGKEVKWQTVYHMLAEDGSPVMEETQTWALVDTGNTFLMDLEWSGKALVDLTVNQHKYGGLFLRMPYEQGVTKAAARNAEGQMNDEAEGQRSPWVHLGMEIKGRENWGSIAVFDHPDNPGYPTFWRVDGQFGIGPAGTREAAWGLKKGESRNYKHRLIIHTGHFDEGFINQAWVKWTGNQPTGQP